MDHFEYGDDGVLHCEHVAAVEIADAVGTPCFVYSKATLIDHYDRLAAAFAPLHPLICYSVKSCSNLSILRVLVERGAGLDLVSGGELHRALLAGAAPVDCVYAGTGKTDEEIAHALRAGVGWINIESEEEFEAVRAIASATDRPCQAALRVNPDVDPQTHPYTATGQRRTKFGVDLDRAEELFGRAGSGGRCRLEGLHVHVGSPVYSSEPYAEAIRKTLALIDRLEARGSRIRMLDLGGGFGADYESSQSPTAEEYARRMVPLLLSRTEGGLRIILEPGRTISANAGVLLLRVVYCKQAGGKTFVICDGGMNVLIRPSHYDAFHFVWPGAVRPEHRPPRRARHLDLPGLRPVDVVGPICESGDFLAVDRPLPPVRRGDLLAVFSTGAYGMVMASRYNSMPLPAEALVDGRRVEVVRRRETYDDLTAHEQDPRELRLGSSVSMPTGDPVEAPNDQARG